jgi:Trk K+ transport system NAD-binding subunit/Kef-type K+ transport system membrane component KefB
MISEYRDLIVFFAGFLIIVLASEKIGAYFARIRLPLISGFLFAGVLAGPFVLDLITAEAIESLRFLEETALAFIAFVAGSELYLDELRDRFKSIKWVSAGLILTTFTLGALAVFLLSDLIPFAAQFPVSYRVAIAILAGSILVAISPSSAVAIVDELRAKGPFTKTAVGVTIIIDVLVILLFSVNSEIADVLITSPGFNLSFVVLIVVELLLALALGLVVGRLLQLVLSIGMDRRIKAILMLLIGYAVFVFVFALREFTHERLPFEILIEPLLVCMIASFYMTNISPYRDEFLRLVTLVSPPMYIFFFTFTGAALRLDILAGIWQIALILFAVRLVGVFIGSFAGGLATGEPMAHNRIRWMAFVTQAGVGLGLAREVAVEHPEFGTAFATMMVSVIVLNQIVGPPLFKLSINRVGEAHTRGKPGVPEEGHEAAIFGVDGQSLALARLLQAHGWRARLMCREADYREALSNGDVNVQLLPDLSEPSLQALGVDKADAIVAMLDDETNYRICEMAYDKYGTNTLIARLNDLAEGESFHELGVLIVHPATAIVSLLDHFVRAPSGTSLLLGVDGDQDIVDVELKDPNLEGMALRDLRLPLDTLILAVQRDGHTIITHGYTRLKLHDCITMVGSTESLDGMVLRFEE